MADIFYQGKAQVKYRDHAQIGDLKILMTGLNPNYNPINFKKVNMSRNIHVSVAS